MTGTYMQLTEDDMFDLLAVIAAIDGRTWANSEATLATTAAWYETIRRELEQRRHFALTRRLAEDAVYAWYGREQFNIRPAGILDVAEEIREQRLARTKLPDPPGYPDAAGFEVMRRAGQDVIASGGDAVQAASAMRAAVRELDGGPR